MGHYKISIQAIAAKLCNNPFPTMSGNIPMCQLFGHLTLCFYGNQVFEIMVLPKFGYIITKHRLTGMHRTLNCFAQVVTTSFLVNYTLVYFASCDIVISMKSNIKEPFVVAEVQVYLTSIIQNKHFSCNVIFT